jgi:cytochrome c peroxidase
MSKRLAYLLLGGSGLALAGVVSLFVARLLPRPETQAEPAPDWPVPESTAEPIRPIPTPAGLDGRKVELGGRLFHDPVLSHDGRVACATCHDLRKGGADGLVRPVGSGGRAGRVNTPTVFNSSLNFRQFWDGRAATLEEQIDGPVTSPLELASDWDEVVGKLRQDPDYRGRFAGLYADGVQARNVKDAIATFERSLLTPNSRFDRFLGGDRGALNEDEQAGYDLFKKYGCVACHQGAGVGGKMFARFGVMAGSGRDRPRFKVPSLRNVALTKPYFHDGSAEDLRKAVKIMAHAQLGRSLSDDDADLIVRFLETLTGEYGGTPL